MENATTETLYCIYIGVYTENLTLHKAYTVLERDAEKGARITGDRGRKVWIPYYCFSDTLDPEFKLYAEFERYSEWDPFNDSCIVWVELNDGRRFVIDTWTIGFFNFAWNAGLEMVIEKARQGNLAHRYLKSPDLIVEELSRPVMEAIIRELLLRNNYNNYQLEKVLGESIFSIWFPEPWIYPQDDLPDYGDALETALRIQLADNQTLHSQWWAIRVYHPDTRELVVDLMEDGGVLLVKLTEAPAEKSEPRVFQNAKHFWKEYLRPWMLANQTSQQ